MKVNIYYGGRGLVDDPTIFVVNKLQEVLRELNVNVERYNLYEVKNQIATLSQTVTDADAVVLATTVEWIGMGGYMQVFLDACWQYSDKSRIGNVCMFPVVMSRTFGEKEVCLNLINSWEMLGGKTENGMSAYVEDTTEFEFNAKYVEMIEKYAEDIYRTISQKRESFPSSGKLVRSSLLRDFVNYTPQESEQLSKYVSDDTFVETQKKDIESLASIYKELLTEQENGGDDYYLNIFNDNYVYRGDYSCTYMFMISDKDKNILVSIDKGALSVKFGTNPDAEVLAKLSKEVLDDIAEGKNTFHRAFMTGGMTAKGNFKSLKMLDELFSF